MEKDWQRRTYHALCAHHLVAAELDFSESMGKQFQEQTQVTPILILLTTTRTIWPRRLSLII